jgi:hypothetical protein
MKKLLIILGVIMLGIIINSVVLLGYGVNKELNLTPEERFNKGVDNFNKKAFGLALSRFNEIDSTSIYYNKAKSYIIKIDSITKVQEELNAKNNIINKKNDSISKRNNQIKAQFSAWDGAHIQLERAIKKGMNDPSSYEHVQTLYNEYKDRLLISTTFRGNNAFGGKVVNTIKAYVDLNGNIIEFVN